MEIIEELIKKLNGCLECSICHECFTDPVTLACGHSYCTMCIRKHRKKANNCPGCRRDIIKGTRLFKSVTLAEIVSIVDAHKVFLSDVEPSKTEEQEVSHDDDEGNAEVKEEDDPIVDLNGRFSEELAISPPLEIAQRPPDFAPLLPDAVFTRLTLTPRLGHRRLDFSTRHRVATKRGTPGRHPDRFDISQWMAEEQLVTGVHYWDVDTSRSVGWAVGVAYDSIGRGDQLGRTPSSWCLELRKDNLSFWHNNMEEPVKYGIPSRVRVAVDVTGGSLSFYSLADCQTLLYSVQVEFSEFLHPAFWLFGLTPENTMLFPQAPVVI